MKKLCSMILAGALALALVGCGNSGPEFHEVPPLPGSTAETQEPAEAVEQPAETTPEVPADLLSGKYAVLIQIENYGDIFVELDADAAPVTVTNFMKLVNEGFYQGLTFHRIIAGFMMQGGESKDKPADTIIGEFSDNGIENPIKHDRGVISMARTMDPNSASSQFFICHQDSNFLDGQYAAFGHVVTGMDVVDKVCEEAVVVDNNGTVPPEYQPVITDILDMTAEYRFAVLGEGGFIPSNELEEALGTDTFASYDELIAQLTPGMAYAYVDILGADEPVLLLNTNGLYDYKDGKMAALDATPYLKQSDGSVRSGSILTSHGTAYPLSVLDGVIYSGSNDFVDGSCITNDNEEPAIMSLFGLYVEYDENGNATYGGFVRDTNSIMVDGAEVAADDDKPLADAYKAFEKAEPIYFTVVE